MPRVPCKSTGGLSLAQAFRPANGRPAALKGCATFSFSTHSDTLLVVPALSFACVIALVMTACTPSRVTAALVETDRYLTESADLERYFAYANAALGRPYQSFYVRPAAEWRRVFDRGDRQRASDLPTLRPARRLVPYRDFLVEYPPGFFLVSIPPALVATSAHGYAIAFGVFMALLLLSSVAVCAAVAPFTGVPVSRAALTVWVLVAASGLGTVVTHRYDAAVALLICTMCWATLAGRPAVLGVATGAAVAIKIVPVLAGLVCAAYLLRERRARDLAIAASLALLTLVLICGPVFLAAPSGLLDTVRYHVDRPLEIGSTAAALLGLWHMVDPGAVSVIRTYGSSNVVGRFSGAAVAASNVASVLGVMVVCAAARRGLKVARTPSGRARVLLAAIAAVLAVVIATGKVASPQYLVWVLPIGVLATLIDRRWISLALLMATLVLSHMIYAALLGDLEALRPWALALVLARNITLVAWTVTIAGGARQ